MTPWKIVSYIGEASGVPRTWTSGTAQDALDEDMIEYRDGNVVRGTRVSVELFDECNRIVDQAEGRV